MGTRCLPARGPLPLKGGGDRAVGAVRAGRLVTPRRRALWGCQAAVQGRLGPPQGLERGVGVERDAWRAPGTGRHAWAGPVLQRLLQWATPGWQGRPSRAHVPGAPLGAPAARGVRGLGGLAPARGAPGHGRRHAASGHLPSTACFWSPRGPPGSAVWGQSAAPTPRGEWRGVRGRPRPSLLDGPGPAPRPRRETPLWEQLSGCLSRGPLFVPFVSRSGQRG